MDEMQLRSFVGKQIIVEMEKELGGRVIVYDGDIYPKPPPFFADLVEKASQDKVVNDKKTDNLFILLRTLGGSPHGAEIMVGITRHCFGNVTFIIDDYAMSAGTMIAMSGNEIMMHYSATLGPIDPQFQDKSDSFFPIGGYLDEYDKMVKKDKNGQASEAEREKIVSTHLGTIAKYRSAVDLSRQLVAEWLFEYKFSTWNKSSLAKRRRANKIARELSHFKKWHSHSRPLGLRHLSKLGIQIVDYHKNIPKLQGIITRYREMMTATNGGTYLVHSRDL